MMKQSRIRLGREGRARRETDLEQPERMAQITVAIRRPSRSIVARDVMSGVIVVNGDRIARRIIPRRVPNIAHAGPDDDGQQHGNQARVGAPTQCGQRHAI
jgi:hypothetical protein